MAKGLEPMAIEIIDDHMALGNDRKIYISLVAMFLIFTNHCIGFYKALKWRRSIRVRKLKPQVAYLCY